MSHQKYTHALVYTVLCMAACFFSVSCSLKPVSAIQVIANPTVSAPIGSKTFTAEAYLSPEKLAEQLNKQLGSSVPSNKKIRVYNYIPDKNDQTMHYLIHYPLETMNFDLGDNFKETDLTKDISLAFAIPAVTKQHELTIPAAKMNEKLLAVFNESSTPISVSLPAVTGGLPPLTGESLPFTISFDGFSTLTFGSGSQIVLTARAAGSADYDITAAEMKDSSGASIPGGVNNNNKVVIFDVAGKTIGKTITVTFTVTLRSSSGSISVTPELQGTIQKATGITQTVKLDDAATGSIEIPLPEGFKGAKIKTGALTLSMTQPHGWKVQHKTTLTQTGTGGLTITPGADAFTAFGTPLSLAGKTLSDQTNVRYNSSVRLVLTDAAYTAGDIPVTLDFAVEEFETITLANKADFTQSKTVPVPADMKKWIDTITLKTGNPVQAVIKMHNSLPAGNDIDIKLTSTVFGIADSPDNTGRFRAGQTDTHTYKGTVLTLPISTTDTFDITAKIIPVNNTSNAFTLKNIKTGKTIELTGKVTFTLDWDTITIKQLTNQTGSFPKEAGKFMDVSGLTRRIKDKIKLDDIPLYFYAGSPLFTDKNATVSLSATYKKDGTDSTMPFLTNQSVPLRHLPSDFFAAVQNDVFNERLSEDQAAFVVKHTDSSKSLSDLLNEYPAEVRLEYKMSMDALVITRQEYENIKGNGKVELRMDMLLDVPVSFTVKPSADYELPLNEFAGTAGKDIFGRTVKTDMSVLDKALKVKSLMVKGSFTNTSGISPTVIVRDNKSGGVFSKKEISLDQGVQSISFTEAEWRKIAETVPFSPQISLRLPKGQHYAIRRGAAVGATLSVVSQLSIDYTIQF